MRFVPPILYAGIQLETQRYDEILGQLPALDNVKLPDWLKRPTRANQYAIAALFICVPLAVILLVRYLTGYTPSPLVLIALIGAAWFGGRVPGVLAAFIIDFCVDYLFDETPGELGNFPLHVTRLLVFCLIAVLTASRRSADVRLRTAAEHQAAVADLGQQALSSVPLDELLPKAAELTRLTLGVDMTSVCQPVADGRSLYFAAASGWKEKVDGLSFDYKTGSSLANWVIAYGEAWSEDLLIEKLFLGSEILRRQGTRGAAGARILHRDGSCGVLGAFTLKPRRFTPEEMDFLRSIANIIGEASDRLKAERTRRETEIMHSIVEAQEAERHRIARDLHDHIGQQMTALRLNLENLLDNFSGNKELAEALDKVIAAARNVDRDIGFLSWELRPTELDELGLENALSSFVREWSKQYGIDAEFSADGNLARGGELSVSVAIETNLYRIAQEGLHNILKHADAKNVSMLLQHRDGNIVMIIEDDGVGFDTGSLDGNGKPGGLGLTGMQERAALLNGTLEIESTRGVGTTLLALIPYDGNGDHSSFEGISR